MEGNPGADACVLVRVWLPDRPGALGAVASRIGAVRGDIVGIDVLERGEGVAIDEFGVVLPSSDLLALLVREIEQVDGCRVEHVTVVSHFPDPRLDALASVAVVCEADDLVQLQAALAAYVGHAFRADWVALVGGGKVLSSWKDPPPERHLLALAGGAPHSRAVLSAAGEPEDLARAALPSRNTILLVGRSPNGFRDRERVQLLALARIADHLWERLGRMTHAAVS
jgi:hypothetical protein